MLAHLLQEPWAREIGQPLLTLLSLNADLIRESNFFSADDWSSRLSEHRGFEPSRQRISEGLRNSGLHKMFNRDPYAMPVRGTGNSN